jgi:anti-anti-sigma regulatory factor
VSITGDVLAAPRVVRPTSTGVSVSVRGTQRAVLTLTGDVDPVVARLVEVVLDTVIADGVRHVIVDLTAVPGVPQPVRDALASASWALERRGGWLLVEGDAEVDRVGGSGIEPRSSLLDAFRAYRAVAGR